MAPPKRTTDDLGSPQSIFDDLICVRWRGGFHACSPDDLLGTIGRLRQCGHPEDELISLAVDLHLTVAKAYCERCTTVASEDNPFAVAADVLQTTMFTREPPRERITARRSDLAGSHSPTTVLGWETKLLKQLSMRVHQTAATFGRVVPVTEERLSSQPFDRLVQARNCLSGLSFALHTALQTPGRAFHEPVTSGFDVVAFWDLLALLHALPSHQIHDYEPLLTLDLGMGEEEHLLRYTRWSDNWDFNRRLDEVLAGLMVPRFDWRFARLASLSRKIERLDVGSLEQFVARFPGLDDAMGRWRATLATCTSTCALHQSRWEEHFSEQPSCPDSSDICPVHQVLGKLDSLIETLCVALDRQNEDGSELADWQWLIKQMRTMWLMQINLVRGTPLPGGTPPWMRGGEWDRTEWDN